MRYLLSTSVNILCIRGTFQNVLCSCWTFCQLQSTIRVTFCQHFLCPRDLQSSFCASAGSSINFQCSLGTCRQHCFRPWDLPSTSVNFPCLRGAFGQLSVRPRDFLSIFPVGGGPSVNFSCVCGTLHQLLRNFCASAGL